MDELRPDAKASAALPELANLYLSLIESGSTGHEAGLATRGDGLVEPARDEPMRQERRRELWQAALAAVASDPHASWSLVSAGVEAVCDPSASDPGTLDPKLINVKTATRECARLLHGAPAETDTDLDAPVRALAVWAMGQGGEGNVLPALVAALQDPVPTIRRLAAEALGNLRELQAIGPLCLALDDDDDAVQRQAAIALSRIGDPAAVPALRRKAEPSSLLLWTVREACRRAIEAMEGAPCVERGEGEIVRRIKHGEEV